VEPQKQNGGIVLPSGMVIHGEPGSAVPQSDKEFWGGSVFEKK
jgi:hypothetical protein